jgi:hypothetical protein
MATDNYSSDADWTVPTGVEEIDIECHGASGGDGESGSSWNQNGSGSGHAGGFGEGTANVTPGETLYIRFGGGGAGGYKAFGFDTRADGGDGGDAADVRQGGTSTGDMIISAGGGGGGGAAGAGSTGSSNAAASDGGDGGGSGQDGSSSSTSNTSGPGGLGEGSSGYSGNSGGEDKRDDGSASAAAAGGGGGGGYTGGGGGSAEIAVSGSGAEFADAAAGGGGGGGGSTPGVTNASSTVGGSNYGGGRVIIEYATPISDLSATVVDGDQIDLTWSDVPDEASYDVYRSESPFSDEANATKVADLSQNTTSYSDTGLEDGEQYYYRVRTVRSDGKTALSNEVSPTTDLPSHTIDSVDATASDELTIIWTRADDSTDGKWELYRSTDGSLGSLIFDTTTLSTSSYVDSGLTLGTTYYYTLRRVAGDASLDVQETGGLAAPPSNITVDAVNGDQFDVSWQDNASNEDGYRVFVSRDGGQTWTNDSGDLPAGTTSYTTTSLLDGEQYRVTVEVLKGGTTRRPLKEA